MKKLFLLILICCIKLAGAEMSFPQKVKLSGELEQRVRLTEKRYQHEPFDLDLIVQDVARVPQLKRRFEEYEGDVSGRTLGSWSYMSRLLGEHPAKLDSIFEAVLRYQASEGYFGKDQKKINWDYWGRQTFGHGRLLGGLVQYYRLTNDERALKAATRLADYLVRSIPEWSKTSAENPWSNRDEWVMWADPKANRQHFVKTHMTSILESLMMLNDVKPNRDYIDAGFALVDLFPDFGHYHSHSYMNTMTGMAMLYDATGDHKLLSRLYEIYWQEIMRYGRPIDGGMREWFPDDHRTEGCSITDWIRLNLYMWKITHDALYLDEAENAWFNALNFHQTANGAFGHATCSSNGYEAAYSEAWWCCTMHGLWAYAELLNFAAAAEDDNVWFNFYAPLHFALTVNNELLQFEIDTKYPTKGLITIRCVDGAAKIAKSHLRLPRWAEKAVVKLNDKAVAVTWRRGEILLQHAWQKGDRLTLEIPLSLRLLDERGNNMLKRRSLPEEPVTACLYYGPLLLGADGKSQRLPVLIYFDPDKDYRIDAPKGPFVLDAHFQIPANTRFGISFESFTTLTPISEITGREKWSDHWRNFIRNGEKPISRHPMQIFHSVKILK